MPDKHCCEYCHNFAEIGSQKEANYLFDVCVYASALFYCVNNSGKVIVGKGHIRSALCNVRARNTHSTADIGGFECGSVVYAVARHRNNVALLLPSLYDTYLVFGGNAGVNRNILYAGVKLCFCHFVQLGAGNGALTGAEYAQFSCYGGCGDNMVTGDHNGAYACTEAGCNRRFCFGTGRVDHTQNTHKGESVFQGFGGYFRRKLIYNLISHRQNTQSVCAEQFCKPFCFVNIAAYATGCHYVKSAFYDNGYLSVYIVNGSH